MSQDDDAAKEEEEIGEILGKYDNLLTTVPDMGGPVRVSEEKKTLRIMRVSSNLSLSLSLSLFFIVVLHREVCSVANMSMTPRRSAAGR